MRANRSRSPRFGWIVSLLAVACNSASHTSVGDVPGAPTDVVAIAGDTQATIQWKAPAEHGSGAITAYNITAVPGDVTMKTTGATSAVFTGLTNGTSYTFTVSATNARGTGPDSLPAAPITPGEPMLPGAPTAVVAATYDARVALLWKPPDSDGGSQILQYIVTAMPGGAVAATVAPEVSFDTLEDGMTYTFTVQAVNAVGTGPASAPSNPVTPSTVPRAPMLVHATPGDCQATVTWAPPEDDGGSPITGYTVTSIPSGLKATTTGATTATVTGLTNGISYVFIVHATNSRGAGADSRPSVGVIPGSVPAAPTNVVAVASSGQASVTWAPPTDTGGFLVLGYRVVADPGGLLTLTNDTSTTVAGLMNGMTYTFTVTAVNELGDSPPSDPSNAVAIMGKPLQPTNVWASAGDAQATVTWGPTVDNGGPLTSYTVTASPGGATVTTDGHTTHATVTGLSNGTSYIFSVHATNAAGTSAESAPSNVVTPATVPQPPTDVTAEATGSGEVAVSWTPPMDTGGSPLTAFVVTVDQTGQTDMTYDRSATFEYLPHGASLTFSVIALNAIGAGAPSAPSNVVTP